MSTPVRSRDPGTSWDAALAQSGGGRRLLQGQILSLLTLRECGDEELVERVATRRRRQQMPPVTPQNVRSRRHELRLQGLVRDTGRTVPTRAGRRATVWAAVPSE